MVIAACVLNAKGYFHFEDYNSPSLKLARTANKDYIAGDVTMWKCSS